MIKTIFNQINKALDGSFSTLAYTSQSELQDFNLNISPWWLTGFVDAEGCFRISVTKNEKYVSGWRVQLFFTILLHNKDKPLLEMVQKFFGVGSIIAYEDNSVEYVVSSFEDLKVIIGHFMKYPLITKKKADFDLFYKAFCLVLNKKHLQKEGLLLIVALKATINRGLSNVLKSSFPDIIPQERPLVLDPKIPDPYWLAGFATGEGCFFAGITGSSTHRLGFQVRLAFELAQHSRDEQLIKSIINYFDCGKIYKKNKKVFNYRVVKYSDLETKIIPFFLKYKLKGVKYKDFQDFLQIAELMKNKVHLTQKGLEQIRKIKNVMNTKRKFD